MVRRASLLSIRARAVGASTNSVGKRCDRRPGHGLLGLCNIQGGASKTCGRAYWRRCSRLLGDGSFGPKRSLNLSWPRGVDGGDLGNLRFWTPMMNYLAILYHKRIKARLYYQWYPHLCSSCLLPACLSSYPQDLSLPAQ